MNGSTLSEVVAEDYCFPAAQVDCGEDGALLARLKGGDETAFEDLVQTSGGRMMSTARRLLRSEEDARDVVQEAFLLAFRSLPSFEGRCRLSTWLHRIVINVALMRLRSRKRRPEVSVEDQLPRFGADGDRRIEPHDVVDLTPADALEKETMRVMLRRCMDRLPDSHRTVILLRDFEDLSTEETADVLGVRAVAVKVRLHRARQALKALLQKELMDDADGKTVN
jgi:RNA polymerase sigma-70 factor (ECF subfamily)